MKLSLMVFVTGDVGLLQFCQNLASCILMHYVILLIALIII